MRFRLHVAVVFIVAAVVAAVLLDTRTSRGQSQDGGKTAGRDAGESHVKPTAIVRERRVEGRSEEAPNKSVRGENASAASALGAAATRNALLRNELNWIFGGKPQQGWYLYTPLINRLLKTDRDAASASFASALARWQQRSGLKPSGMLDEESLYAMISQWQGKRLKDRTPAQPDQLITAPASGFYDPERRDELRQVERQTYGAYKRMVAAAVADPPLHLAHGKKGELAPGEKYLKIISAFRTRDYQEQLRRESPNAGSAGLAVNSPHFTGRALDLYVGGEPVETKDANRAVQAQTQVYQWLVRNAERFGFQPYYYEPWHWEYVAKEGSRQRR